MRAQRNCWIKTAAFFRTALCASLIGATTVAWAQEPRELVLVNWSEYMDPALVTKFEETHNARLKMIYFDDEDTRDQLMVESDGKGYDLVVLAGRNFANYRARGWLAPLDETNTPNLKHIEPRWRTIFPDAEGHAAPYLWGTLGIAYRADLLPDGLHSLKQIFQPGEALRHKISMSGDAGDTIGMALKSLGYSLNSAESRALDQVEDLLLKLKPYVRAQTYVVSENSALVSGEVVAGLMYNGDALTLAEKNPNIRYVVPDEGTNLWVDYMAVLEGANDKDLARSFVNFLNEPANAAQLAQTLHYATPNAAAKKLLPAEVLADNRIYPSEDVLAKSEIFEVLPPRVEKRRSAIYAKAAY